MGRRDIIFSPTPLLHKPTIPALPNTKFLGGVVRDLWDTLFYLGKDCAGLAANQIGEEVRVCIIKQGSLVLINPYIRQGWGKVPSVESCFSLPGYEAIVPRYNKIFVAYQEMTGQKKSILVSPEDTRKGIVIQHEIDHLDGITISDYVDGSRGKKGGQLVANCDPESTTYLAYVSQESMRNYA